MISYPIASNEKQRLAVLDEYHIIHTNKEGAFEGIEEPIELIKAKSAKRLKISESDINKIKIIRESVDARKRNNINSLIYISKP